MKFIKTFEDFVNLNPSPIAKGAVIEQENEENKRKAKDLEADLIEDQIKEEEEVKKEEKKKEKTNR